MKKIDCYIKALGILVEQVVSATDLPITGVTNDSRLVQPGNLFVAIFGAAVDGHNYISKAIAGGAVCIIHSQPIELPHAVTGILVSNTYFAYALAAECFYDYPVDHLRLTAVTGTNGKTTTAYMLNQLLQYAGNRCGLITTIKYVSGERTIPASRTTPEATELQKLFSQMVEDGCSDVVMEASSHGLVQHRLGRAGCEVAVFTNLTRDHLDYHRTMDDYFQAKTMLFTEYLSVSGSAVINADDAYADKLLRLIRDRRIITFGKRSECKLRIGNIELRRDGSSFTLEFEERIAELMISMPGEHNIYNFTAACGAALALGMPLELIVKHAAESFAVPGRLELLQLNNSPAVYVDYAHTDDALDNILRILEQLKSGKIITLFGCGGDRDKGKRPRMGRVAGHYSDYIILTNDNPRSENPEAILAEIKAGIPEGILVKTIPDRAEAIAAALDIADSDDIVLIAGKGHETTQEQNAVFTPFDDREITQRLLERFYS
ncbi:MAG: UDP-N-acetylmuramoyl-L-alanyl-D-glutamate--2,6-diaminopimelate ligase [Victivallaceae bacterium]|nr:UDP-N-acetylmuramoyl-L-alanyl-D-glutamate--2,6-diaminopimelate ligase [Victivallaceae bacterium]